MGIVPLVLSNPNASVKGVVALVVSQLAEHDCLSKQCKLSPVVASCGQFIACAANLVQDSKPVDQEGGIAE